MLILITILIGEVNAIPTFGTLMPKKNSYQAGGRADFIFERDVKDHESAKTATYTYTLSYGFSDWFAFDGLIGWGDVRSEHTGRKALRYPFNFAGGYGWRAKIYENDKHKIDWVWGFQHVSIHPTKQWYAGKKYGTIWDEWQFSTVFSKKVGILAPYCGIKWSFIYLINTVDGDRRRRISNGSPVGLVVGADMHINDYLYLNSEGRFFDETGFNTGITVRY